MAGSPKKLVSAFVGRSFADGDQGLWNELREFLDSLRHIGFEHEDAKEAQPRSISKKVRDGIERNQIYIGILTRRRAIVAEPSREFLTRIAKALKPDPVDQWTGSDWIVEEVGYALGREKYVLLMIEEGVQFPPTDLDSDNEYISFDRRNLQSAQRKLNQIIAQLVGERLPEAAASTAPMAPAAEAPPEAQRQEPSESDKFAELSKLVREGKIEEADSLQGQMLKEEDTEERTRLEVVLHALRARAGDTKSLSWLRNAADNPDATLWLARLYVTWGQRAQAIAELSAAADRFPPADQSPLFTALVANLRKAGDLPGALSVIERKLAIDQNDADRADSFDDLSDYAKDAGDSDLSLAALEQAVQLQPQDSGLRFKLAALYADNDRHRLSAFHYKQLADRDSSQVGALNNLAVAYGDMKLPDREVATFEAIANRHELAKANLAHIYANAGFVQEGKRLAKEALESKDNHTVDRAQYALNHISEMRSKSDKEINELSEATEAERKFRAMYAPGFIRRVPSARTVDCVFPYGALLVTLSGNVMRGEAEEEYQLNTLLSMAYAATGRTSGKRTRTFEATLRGCAGKFTYKVSSQTIIGDESHTGLIVVGDDLASMSLLELNDDKPAKLYEVRTTPVA